MMSFAIQGSATASCGTGRIAIDEHSSVACMIHDVTPTGLRLTLLDGTEIPATFVLFAGSDVHVCRIVRRGDEEIEARFAELGAPAQSALRPVTTPRLGLAPVRRRFSDAQPLRRAA